MQVYGLSYSSVGLAFFCYGLFNALQFIGGFFSDKIGRAQILFTGISLTVVAFVIIGIAPSFAWMLAGILLYSFGGSLWNISVWTHMSDIAQKEHFQGEAMGAYMAIVKIAGFLSFLAAGTLSLAIGLQKVYLLYSAVLFIGTLASIPYLHRPAQAKQGA